MIHALSLDQPTCWHLLQQAAPVVPAPGAKPGDYLAIHATCIVDLGEVQRLAEAGLAVPAIPDMALLEILAIGQVQAVGPDGALLGNIRRITPIRHRGGVGLWTPTADLTQQLRAAWVAAGG